MSHGTATRLITTHDPHAEPTDGLGLRLVGARLERLATLAASLHAQELVDHAPDLRGPAREPRVVRHRPSSEARAR